MHVYRAKRKIINLGNIWSSTTKLFLKSYFTKFLLLLQSFADSWNFCFSNNNSSFYFLTKISWNSTTWSQMQQIFEEKWSYFSKACFLPVFERHQIVQNWIDSGWQVVQKTRNVIEILVQSAKYLGFFEIYVSESLSMKWGPTKEKCQNYRRWKEIWKKLSILCQYLKISVWNKTSIVRIQFFPNRNLVF